MTAMPVAPHQHTRRRGQTLAEFALTLPLLLLLLFGVLEFGRLFQSWVTLQNAARAAARYAITGRYNDQKYDLDFLVPCLVADTNLGNPVTYPAPVYGAGGAIENRGISVYNRNPANVPPIDAPDTMTTNTLDPSGNLRLVSDSSNEGASRRAYQDYKKANGDLILGKWQPFTVQAIDAIEDEFGVGYTVNIVRINTDESFYSTWYGQDNGVNDCYPSDESLQLRKDMLRLASIYDEARRGAAGLALDAPLTGNGSREEFEAFMREFWSNPSPRQETKAWFNFMMCSNRDRIYQGNVTDISNNPDDPDSFDAAGSNTPGNLRFHSFMGPGTPDMGDSYDYPGGACILKEKPVASSAAMTDNYNRPWADAGDSGDRIAVIITYNHPLITPLGLARFIRIQARRSAVNETFKVSNAEKVLGPSGVAGGSFSTPTPLPPTETPLPSDTPPHTPTFTATASDTPTATAAPFSCDLISAGNVLFDSDTRSVVAEIVNGNQNHNAVLTRTVLFWNTSKILTTSPNAYVGFSSLGSDVHWIGTSPAISAANAANVSPIDSTDAGRGTFFGTSDTLFNRTIWAGGSAIWKGTFLSLEDQLANLQHGSDFNGTKFYVTEMLANGSLGSVTCELPLEVPPVPPLPTAPPPNFTPSPTHTPDCADNRMRVEFVRFDALGDVRLRVTNTRPIPGYFIGFTITWPTRIQGLRLSKVVVGGSSANDIPDPQNNPNGRGKVVWQNLAGASVSPTLSNNASHGTWVTDHVFGPNSITEVHLDFTGTGPATLQALGVHPSEFNGTLLRILCTPPGGPGNGGTGPTNDGDIGFDFIPPPAATNPPPPTNTPGPTLTPSKTPTPRPPTATFTKGPPTKTFTPTFTQGATKTFTPTFTPTPRDEGTGDG